MAITPGDDFLIHQTPYTVDRVFTSDRNFYDRYFFNGYRNDGGVYFALAMGAYPNMGVFDAAFSVVRNGKQRCIRASRAIGGDRLNTKAGPISVEVLEPLKRLRIRVEPNEWGIEADAVFEARAMPMEEPHFLRLADNVPVMDYTRMTQQGMWSGTLSIDGDTYDLGHDTWWGTRDHSWGIRNIGGRDPRGAPPAQMPQFYWNWAPANFDDLAVLYTVSELSDGTRWHESGVIQHPYPDGKSVQTAVEHDITFAKGTRWMQHANITFTPRDGEPLVAEYEAMYHFLMRGIGYGDPKWGHGMWVGPNEVEGFEWEMAKENPAEHLHVQTVSRVKAGGRTGIGIFEIIVLGPHDRYGFTDLMSPA